MACQIADNKPLAKLASHLGISPRCHGRRSVCIKGLPTYNDDLVMGAAGAALGYCQALFANTGNPASHTEKVTRLLREIDAPWCASHELQWAYRLKAEAAEFLSEACTPLLGTGRVPILITALDPAREGDELGAILATSPSVPDAESILVRVMLNDGDSVTAVTRMLQDILTRARSDKQMPKWWPLLQGTVQRSEWVRLKRALGSDWQYVNVAVNPFIAEDVFAEVADQITVGQIPIAQIQGIHQDGCIQLHPSVRILGAEDHAAYSMPDFTQRLSCLPTAPTLIILGPSQSDWSDEENQQRIASLLPLVRGACNRLWDKLSPQRRNEVWTASA